MCFLPKYKACEKLKFYGRHTCDPNCNCRLLKYAKVRWKQPCTFGFTVFGCCDLVDAWIYESIKVVNEYSFLGDKWKNYNKTWLSKRIWHCLDIPFIISTSKPQTNLRITDHFSLEKSWLSTRPLNSMNDKLLIICLAVKNSWYSWWAKKYFTWPSNTRLVAVKWA